MEERGEGRRGDVNGVVEVGGQPGEGSEGEEDCAEDYVEDLGERSC